MSTVAAPRTRRTGLCPTFTTPSVQRDGLLMRIPLVGGRLGLEQVDAIADVAERHGNGVIELTNRGNLQLRGVTHEGLEAAVAGLAATGLGDEMARIVTVSPFAGPGERSLRAVVVAALAAIDLSRLSGKFVVHVDDGSHTADGADMVISIALNRTTAAFVDLGRVRYELPLADLPAVVQSVVALCVEHGADARWKDVSTELPHPSQRRPAASESRRAPVGIITASGVHVVAGMPLGRTNPIQLRDVAKACATNGSNGLSISPWRSIVVECASVTAASGLVDGLEAAGLVTTADHPAHGVITCIGRAGCWQTELDTLLVAAEVIADRAAFGSLGETVHVSGCAKSCACHDAVAVTLLGRDDSSGFDIVRSADRCRS